MTKFNLLLLLTLNLLFISCGSNNGNKKSDFSLEIENKRSDFKLNESLSATIGNTKNKPIDSVSFYLGSQFLKSTKDGKANIELENSLLGNQILKAIVFSEETTDTLSKSIKILNSSTPTVYTYKVVKTYPHDITSYTQGLEFHEDTLYESIGQYGQSKLRQVELETGQVLKEIKLDNEYFAEGITIIGDKLFQLTWQEDEGFIYDLNTFEKTGSFGYNHSKEGWGLCNNGENIFKSDGTEKIWILDPETLAEKSYIQPTTNTSIKSQFNELEWVDGMIYANTYQFPSVAIINPENGGIEGIINFKGLKEKLGNLKDLDPRNDVLNGIAYNPNSKKLYVTGKKWDTIFEVEIIKK